MRLERPLSRERDSSSAPVEKGLVSSQSSPSHVASRRELGLLLADALATLPEDYREVIILRQLEDLPFSEIALKMGRTVESVKHLWVRALARLRRKVEAYG
ncbi:MAG: sigma-70 family RNA polymerase sigma factor [Isosphaeraceae bacterium]